MLNWVYTKTSNKTNLRNKKILDKTDIRVNSRIDTTKKKNFKNNNADKIGNKADLNN